MLSINLSEFAKYTDGELYKYLLTQNQTSYHITVPKTPGITRFLDTTILADYYYITYAGELLNNISENFSYFTPDPLLPDPFFFKFTCNNVDELTDVLFYLSKGLELHIDNFLLPLNDKFKDEAHEFIAKALEEDDTNPACYGLFQVVVDYLNKLE
ncbi:hypothetical protein GALL_103200 [mine drainage metagenome]|uniref:Uncharacterized protein n=1 Tax=mine drainage metagenome TaxID=410659 RepID=A0A1J5SGW2_9ZZZZ